MGYTVRFKLWVEKDGQPVLTPARADLLRHLRRYRSLAEASRALGVPYKKAHRLVASIDERMGGGIVSRRAGGPDGGATQLNEQGSRLLEDYEKLCNRALDAVSSAHFAGLPLQAAVAGVVPSVTRVFEDAAAATRDKEMSPLYERARMICGHHCPGMVLGVRMAAAGIRELELEPGRPCASLGAVVETARCAADAAQAVTHCSVGRGSLRVVECGKMAATFARAEGEMAVRVVALESSQKAADLLYPDLPGRKMRQMAAYRMLPDDALLQVGSVQLLEPIRPGRVGPHERALCPRCGEAFEQRFGELAAGRLQCASCAGRKYFEPVAPTIPVS